MNITTHCYSQHNEEQRILSLFPCTLQLNELTVLYARKRQQCIVLVDLDQIEASLLQQPTTLADLLLSNREQNFFTRFSYMKRRREWLGGRFAVKTAIMLLTHNQKSSAILPQYTVLPDKYGRPLAENAPGVAISISHSNRFATGFATLTESCGIDIQEISAKLIKLKKYYTQEKEITILTNTFPDMAKTRLTMLWTAKEALKKSMLHDHPSIFSSITLQQITQVASGCYSFSCTVKDRSAAQVLVHEATPYILATNITHYYARTS